jgi:hypothetical protein
MDPHDPTIASRATQPSEQDVAMAEEAILGALSAGQVSHYENLIDRVRDRLAHEPTPELFSQLRDVSEEECRRAWSAATALTALANLQWTGQVIPCDALEIPSLTELSLHWRSSAGGGGIRDMRPEYSFPIGKQLRLSSWLKAIGPDSLSALRAPLPGSGEKVRRVLRESAEAYRRGLNVAAAILLGVASEAAWTELGEALAKKTGDPALRGLIDSERSRTAALTEHCLVLLPGLLKTRRDQEWRRLATEAAHLRDLRDHAVHQPEGRFEDELFTRAAIGVELQSAVGYFRRLYATVEVVRAI